MASDNELELYLVKKLQKIDKYTRQTSGSGNKNETLDIQNKYFYIEAKQKRTHDNITIDYKEEYLKSLNNMPIDTDKELLIATENSKGDRFITMEAESFFRLIDKLHIEEKKSSFKDIFFQYPTERIE